MVKWIGVEGFFTKYQLIDHSYVADLGCAWEPLPIFSLINVNENVLSTVCKGEWSKGQTSSVEDFAFFKFYTHQSKIWFSVQATFWFANIQMKTHRQYSTTVSNGKRFMFNWKYLMLVLYEREQSNRIAEKTMIKSWLQLYLFQRSESDNNLKGKATARTENWILMSCVHVCVCVCLLQRLAEAFTLTIWNQELPFLTRSTLKPHGCTVALLLVIKQLENVKTT